MQQVAASAVAGQLQAPLVVVVGFVVATGFV